ncbi:MAG: ABC transporter ATP-binding protein [Bacteroidetes bacterium GWF2_33_16]|nr:MAG: ABC transporter ATP-binding protein [Bacteroidetes bacterium GWE2_32_14]OFY05186.1 MAG: ABC transporter ATP-binding protein [Bacteroidetes bacterium GWF2_33_16]
MELLRAQNVDKRFANHLALDKVNISVPENSIYGLLGPNGAGKTTLIRIINRITAPDSGEIFLNGRPLHPDDVHNIGYLPEERGLYKKMKVGEQALYLAQLKGLSKHDALKKLKFWFEKFEIQAWWDKKVEELSKGMQQKVQFITTVIHEPKLLIFDEPFSGFDPINANMLKQEILDMKANGATIIFSTHNMGSVEELCDHITLINKSKNILEGQIDEIRNRYKSNIYEISFHGEIDKLEGSLNNHYEVVKKLKVNGKNAIQVKLLHQTNENELLSLIIPSVEIISFNEVMPSMNDIFIDVVNENKNK